MSRSETFPTHYRVGSITDVFQVTRDVYWSPADGYGIERYYECLASMPADDVASIEWFDKDGDYDKLLEARIQNIRINDTLPVALCDAMRAYANDLDYGDGCEADKVATLRNGSGV
jgi:hypothetical protein